MSLWNFEVGFAVLAALGAVFADHRAAALTLAHRPGVGRSPAMAAFDHGHAFNSFKGLLCRKPDQKFITATF
jgi:hypothetical protein